MIIVKMTKGAQSISGSLVDYLKKDKDLELDRLEKLERIAEGQELNPDNPSVATSDKNTLTAKESDYKQKKGSELKLSGDLRLELYKAGYGKLSSKEQSDALVIAWNKRLEQHENQMPINGVGVRRFVISPDPKQIQDLNQDQKVKLIEKTIQDSMKKFEQKYYKSEGISYAYSVHKDKAHIHGHVYLHPISDEGKYISMNAGRYTKKGLRKSDRIKPENKLEKYKIMTENSFQKELKKLKEWNITQERVQALDMVKNYTINPGLYKTHGFCI